MMMNSTIIDDQDLSRVTYAGSWIFGGSPNEYKGTVSSTTSINDSFTVAFKGTSVSVYGTVDSTSGGVVTSYTVDGAPAAQVTSIAGAGDTYNQLFWASPTLASGDHQLLVKMVKINPDPQRREGTIWFDYFNITQGPLTSPSPSPSPITPPPATTRKKSHKIGPIVGIACGIIILVALGVLLLLYRRRRRPSKEVDSIIKPEPPAVSSYPNPVVPNSANHSSTDQFLVTRDTSQGPNGYTVTLVPPPPMDYAAGNRGSEFSPTASSSINGQSSRQGGYMYSANPDQDAVLKENQKAMEKGNEARKYALSSAEPLQHADSGLRAIDPETLPPGGRVELPPAYTPA